MQKQQEMERFINCREFWNNALFFVTYLSLFYQSLEMYCFLLIIKTKDARVKLSLCLIKLYGIKMSGEGTGVLTASSPVTDPTESSAS